MTPVETQALRRENNYLKQRCAQLEGDIVDLESQVGRLQQAHERMTGQMPGRRVATGLGAQPSPLSNPLSGGQG